MRSGSPVLPAGRSPAGAEEGDPQVPVLLLQDMNLCYRLLRRLVPGVTPGRAVSRVEILRHVIDYIEDLQTELEASCPAAGGPGEPLHRDSSGNNTHSGRRSDSPETHTEVEESRTVQR